MQELVLDAFLGAFWLKSSVGFWGDESGQGPKNFLGFRPFSVGIPKILSSGIQSEGLEMGIVCGVSAVGHPCHCVHRTAGKGKIYHVRTRRIPSFETD